MRPITSSWQAEQCFRKQIVRQDVRGVPFRHSARIAMETASLLLFCASSDASELLTYDLPAVLRLVPVRDASRPSASGQKCLAGCDFPRSRPVAVSACSFQTAHTSLGIDSLLRGSPV